MINLKKHHTMQQSAIIASLQVNPIFTGNVLTNIKVIALDGYGKQIPVWAQPHNRRAPTANEIKIIINTPVLTNESFGDWLERASQSYLKDVYGDLINSD